MDAARWSATKRLLQEALERPPEARDAFLAAIGDDEGLRAEVAALLAGHDAAGDRFDVPPIRAALLLAEAASTEAAPPARVGSYRLLRELGHGGMGTVYLADRENGDFRQQVAIKVIQRGMGSEAIVRRFRNERQILASLNHPNIARLYEGGTTEDGLPYFVMEYVDGEPIDRWCAARGSSTDDRLGLFRQVCGAVHYAHQNLVVHRDLKPGNILVTADGTPKLLDFGIAKLLDPDASTAVDLTAFARPMTPEYASPEQVRGEPITTASDVYSLGVLLYLLSTGRPPYRIDRGASIAEVIRIVSDEQPAPPSDATSLGEAHTAPGARRSPALPADLDAIVLQAMRKDPARRYASADQLSDDLRRLLAGMPVQARRDSLGYRARKLVGRHRAGAAAVALAVVALIATTAAAVRQAQVAERQRARAERRFGDVRRLANSFLFEFHDAIQDLPGSTAARELVVRKALEYLDGLAAEAGSDRGLLAELAQAYQRVGDVQGMPYRASLGHSEDALHSYEKALALRQRLLHEQPANPEYRLARAVVESRIGAVLGARGDTRGALQRHRAALAEVSALGNRERYRPAQAETALAAVAVGDDEWELGDMDAAIASYRGALKAARERRRDQPADREARRYVGVVEQRLGDALALEGRWPESLEHQQASFAVDQGLVADYPTSAESQRDLATDYTRLAVAHQALGDTPSTLAEHRQALEIRERLRAADPRDSRALTDLAESMVQLAEVEAAVGDYPAALAGLRRALPLRRQQAATDPANMRSRDDLATALTHLGSTLAASGDRAAAMTALREALRVRESIAATTPELSASNPALANLYFTLGQLQQHAGGSAGGEACDWLVKAKLAFDQLRDRAGLTGDAVGWAAAAEREAALCR
jgi:non-specific serine/threonine protein kinase/serine/threonine-protein kinase